MRLILRKIDISKIKKNLPWVMVYGRRKTGKTFLVENFINYDKYFFVNRDSTVLDKETGKIYSYNEFFEIFKEIIGYKTVVIDEFHRLPPIFTDYLHSIGIKGEFILVTSTLWIARNLLSKGQPLLGLVRSVRIDLIDEREILLELSKTLKGK